MKFVTAKDYRTPEKRELLKDMAEKWCNNQKHIMDGKTFSTRYLDYLMSLDLQKPGFGFAEGVEDDDGHLHCLICAEIIENMWINQADCNIICILTNRPSDTKYLHMLLDKLYKWADNRGAENVYLFSWSHRKAYEKLFERLGFKPSGYTYKRKLK